jgi:CO dehydrogenase maturation factor
MSIQLRLDDLPPEYVSTSPEGIRLVTVGKVRGFGKGCACPFNFLARTVLKNLLLGGEEVVLVDTDAGIEHLGRGVEEGCDAIVAVADPTAEALVLAKSLKEFSQSHSKRFWLVLNKATPRVVEYVGKRAKEMGLEVDGMVSFDEEVFESCLEGGTLRANEAARDVEAMLRKFGLLENP